MPKDRRTLEDDKMETPSLLPRSAPNFKAAYPGVKSLRVEVTEHGDGVRFGPQRQPLIQKLDEHSVRPTLHCSNPLCQQGGVDIESLLQRLTLSRATEQQETVHCCGHEGSPKGRNRGRSCLNYFRVKVSISYDT